MNTSPPDKVFETDPELDRLLNTAISELDSYHKTETSTLAKEMGMLQHVISHLRNRLIELYRAEGSPVDSEVGKALRKVNLALSHIVGIEYPVSGIDRSLLTEADNLLKELRSGNRK